MPYPLYEPNELQQSQRSVPRATGAMLPTSPWRIPMIQRPGNTFMYSAENTSVIPRLESPTFAVRNSGARPESTTRTGTRRQRHSPPESQNTNNSDHYRQPGDLPPNLSASRLQPRIYPLALLLGTLNLRRLARFWQEPSQYEPFFQLKRYMEKVREYVPMVYPVSLSPRYAKIQEFMVVGSRSSLDDRLINKTKLVEQIRNNASRLTELPDHASIVVQIRFVFDILNRCMDILDFLQGERVHLGLHVFCPLMDCWIFETRILDSSGEFNPLTSEMVRMYGLGPKEVSWLSQNRNEEERREQFETLKRYHVLKSCYGSEAVEDIREQFCYCFWEIRNVRAQHSKPSAGRRSRRSSGQHVRRKKVQEPVDDARALATQSGPSSAAATRGSNSPSSDEFIGKSTCLNRRRKSRQVVFSRKREFKIAKIMVDRAWQELMCHNRRISPVRHRNDEKFAENKLPPPTSNWENLHWREKRRLLGYPTAVHPTHSEFELLALRWIKDEMNRDYGICWKLTIITARLHQDTPLEFSTTNHPDLSDNSRVTGEVLPNLGSLDLGP